MKDGLEFRFLNINMRQLKILLFMTILTFGKLTAKKNMKICRKVISEPLEKCSNIFSAQNGSESLFEKLKDFKSRKERRLDQCYEIMLRLEKKMQSKSKKRHYYDMEKNVIKFQNNRTKNRTKNAGCNKVYFASIIDMVPFSYQIERAIEIMFKHCCPRNTVLCPSKTILTMSSFNGTSINKSDIVFPVLGKSSAQQIHGYHFAPIYDAPSVYYFTTKQSQIEVTYGMLDACKHLWPLLTICLLLAMISGFIAWSIETRVNEEEFPRAFHVGLFEGFWWSFISMTTVGYGDKTPKSRLGRIFSIMWILVGITICSMFTASLTTEITKLTTPPPPSMNGKTVGVLKSRLLDALIAAKQGAIIREVEHKNISEGTQEMLGMLKNGSIDGFVVDTATYHFFLSWAMCSKYKTRINQKIKINRLVRTEVQHDGDKLSFGLLFKRKKDFELFQNYFAINQLHLQACYHLQLNKKMLNNDLNKIFLMDPSTGLFYHLLFIIIPTVLLIVIVGTCYEYRRYIFKKHTNRSVEVLDSSNELWNIASFPEKLGPTASTNPPLGIV